MRESPPDPEITDAVGGDELVSPVENIVHPEYDFSAVAAIELIRDNSKLFNTIPHIARSQLLTTFYSFFDQEKNSGEGKHDSHKFTLLKSGDAPAIFKSIFGHFIHVCGFAAPTKIADTMKIVIQLTTKLMRDGIHKPVEFFRNMIRFEHSNVLKYKEYGRHSIDSTGGVHGNTVDLSGYEGTPGELLHFGLAKGVLEILQNQADLAGVAPFTKQDVANTRHSQKESAREILEEIRTKGWDDLIGLNGSDLNDSPLLRESSVDRSKFTHDITTKLSDPTLQPTVVDVPRHLGSGMFMAQKDKKELEAPEQDRPVRPPEFSKLDLKEKKLAGIPVRLITSDGQFYVDTNAKKLLGISSFELESVLTQPNKFPLKWKAAESMYEHEDEANWPVLVLSTSQNQPNPYGQDSKVFRFRGAMGRTPLHLHISQYKTNLGKAFRKDMYFWSGHWSMNGSEQNEIVKETKKLIKFKFRKNGKPRSRGSDFVIYPPLPSKDFKYREVTPSRKELDFSLRGLASSEPNRELTRARLESLGLTDLEIRTIYDDNKSAEALKKINKYWNKPITDEVMRLMDPNVVDYKTPVQIEESKIFADSMNERIRIKYGDIDESQMEIERVKIRKEIRNYLSPQFNRTQLCSIMAGLDGSTGFCVVPNPQKQNGLGIGLAATLGEGVQRKLRKFLTDIHPVRMDSQERIGINWEDRQEILSAFIATSLEQTYTRLGIAPLAVLDDMVAEYPDLAEAIARVVTPELKQKTFLVTQLSELPGDNDRDEVAESDYFTTAVSARRDTISLGIGIKGNHMSWRVRLSDPDFFEKINYDHITKSDVNKVAMDFADIYVREGKLPESQFSENVEFMNMAIQLWNIREASGVRGMLDYGFASFLRNRASSSDEVSNAIKLDNFMKIIHGASDDKIREIFPKASAYYIGEFRSKLLDGFKMVTVATIQAKQRKFMYTTNTFTSEVADLAKHTNFVDLLRISTPTTEKFHARYPETRDLDIKGIRLLLDALYTRLQTSGQLGGAQKENATMLHPMEKFVIALAKLAESDEFVNDRFKFDLARTIPSYGVLAVDQTGEFPALNIDAMMDEE